MIKNINSGLPISINWILCNRASLLLTLPFVSYVFLAITEYPFLHRLLDILVQPLIFVLLQYHENRDLYNGAPVILKLCFES